MTAVANAPQGIDVHEFRATMRRQASTVAVVTAPGRPPVGLTVTSFTSVSLRPQLVSFSIAETSSSWPAVSQAEHVAIHLLQAGQEQAARTFATSGIDRFAAHTAWRWGAYGLPLLDGVLAVLICGVEQRIAAGDHWIVLGRPVSATYVDGDPLLHHQGGYLALETESVTPQPR